MLDEVLLPEVDRRLAAGGGNPELISTTIDKVNFGSMFAGGRPAPR